MERWNCVFEIFNFGLYSKKLWTFNFFQYLSIFMLSFQTVVKMFTTLDNIIYYYYNSDQCPFKYIFLYFCNAYLHRVISISLINHHDFLCRRYSINNT